MLKTAHLMARTCEVFRVDASKSTMTSRLAHRTIRDRCWQPMTVHPRGCGAKLYFSPASRARTIAWARFATWSLPKMFVIWFRTVLELSTNFCAIS